MTKRSHANTSRLTARERMLQVCAELRGVGNYGTTRAEEEIILRALQAHARETLGRAKRRVRPMPSRRVKP